MTGLEAVSGFYVAQRGRLEDPSSRRNAIGQLLSLLERLEENSAEDVELDPADRDYFLRHIPVKVANNSVGVLNNLTRRELYRKSRDRAAASGSPIVEANAADGLARLQFVEGDLLPALEATITPGAADSGAAALASLLAIRALCHAALGDMGSALRVAERGRALVDSAPSMSAAARAKLHSEFAQARFTAFLSLGRTGPAREELSLLTQAAAELESLAQTTASLAGWAQTARERATLGGMVRNALLGRTETAQRSAHATLAEEAPIRKETRAELFLLRSMIAGRALARGEESAREDWKVSTQALLNIKDVKPSVKILHLGRLAEYALQFDLNAAARYLASLDECLQSVPPGRADTYALAEARAQAAVFKLGLGRRSGLEGDELAKDTRRAIRSFEAFLDAWRKRVEPSIGIAPLRVDSTRFLLGELIEGILATKDVRDPRVAAFEAVLHSQEIGGVARAHGIRNVEASAVQAALTNEERGLLTFVPAPNGGHVFAVDANGIVHGRIAAEWKIDQVARALEEELRVDRRQATRDRNKNLEELAQAMADAVLPDEVRRRIANWKGVTVVGADLLTGHPLISMARVSGDRPMFATHAIDHHASVPAALEQLRRRASMGSKKRELEWVAHHRRAARQRARELKGEAQPPHHGAASHRACRRSRPDPLWQRSYRGEPLGDTSRGSLRAAVSRSRRPRSPT